MSASERERSDNQGRRADSGRGSHRIGNRARRLAGQAVLLLLVGTRALNACAVEDGFLDCRKQHPGSDPQASEARLKCYDAAKHKTREGAMLWDEWRLGDAWLPLGEPQLYRPIYFIVRHTDSLANPPTSPTHPVAPTLKMRHLEAKFQLSFKSEIVSPENLTDRLRLWFGYTQQSNWQVMDVNDSRPFRNTNYEPELIATIRASDSRAPNYLAPKIVNLGLVHQSNGQSDPLSRSWNRAYAQLGWQLRDRTSLLLRGWRRLSEDPAVDDNPDLVKYQGNGDVLLRHDVGRNRFSVLLRKRFGQIDWGIRFASLQGHVQVSSGYGETLLDYNHRQTTVGLGLSFGDW